MELGDTEAISVENAHDRGVRHVDADLDDRGGDQHVNVASTKRAHDRFLLGRRELTVQQAEAKTVQLATTQFFKRLRGRASLDLL